MKLDMQESSDELIEIWKTFVIKNEMCNKPKNWWSTCFISKFGGQINTGTIS